MRIQIRQTDSEQTDYNSNFKNRREAEYTYLKLKQRTQSTSSEDLWKTKREKANVRESAK